MLCLTACIWRYVKHSDVVIWAAALRGEYGTVRSQNNGGKNVASIAQVDCFAAVVQPSICYCAGVFECAGKTCRRARRLRFRADSCISVAQCAYTHVRHEDVKRRMKTRPGYMARKLRCMALLAQLRMTSLAYLYGAVTALLLCEWIMKM